MSERIAIAGATGLVGRKLILLMHGKGVPPTSLGLFASADSAGAQIPYGASELTVTALDDCDFAAYDAALFCIGDELSAQHVPRALDAGCAVVDKSNAFRLNKGVPLVVPGINDDAVTESTKLVANPNCTTIVMSHALAPLENSFGIASIFAASYQSVSGAGKAAVEQLKQQISSSGYSADVHISEICAPGELAFNTHCRIGSIRPGGQSSEEYKLVAETRKIFSRPELKVFAHTVRVPVLIGHGIAATVQLTAEAEIEQIIEAWDSAPDVLYMGDDLPTPAGSSRHSRVEVGRLRREPDLENGWSFFVTGDNINIGAALNGWRIFNLLRKAGAVPEFKDILE